MFPNPTELKVSPLKYTDSVIILLSIHLGKVNEGIPETLLPSFPMIHNISIITRRQLTTASKRVKMIVSLFIGNPS